jgi:hypothetical protein
MANLKTKMCAHIPCLCTVANGKNTAERRVAKREAKTWKSHVNATIQRVPSQFGNFCQATPLTWPTNRGQIEQT